MSLELSGVVNCCQFGRAPTTTHRLAVGVDETITLLTLSRVDGVAQVGGVPQQYVLDLECTLALEVVPLAISWSPKLDMQVAKDGASEDIVPFSPLAFAGDDKCVYALSFSVENPSMFQVQRGEGHTEAINAVDYNGTGEFIVSAGDDCTVRVWNNEAMYLTTIPFKQPIADVKFAPLGKLVSTLLFLRLLHTTNQTNKQTSKQMHRYLDMSCISLFLYVCDSTCQMQHGCWLPTEVVSCICWTLVFNSPFALSPPQFQHSIVWIGPALHHNMYWPETMTTGAFGTTQQVLFHAMATVQKRKGASFVANSSIATRMFLLWQRQNLFRFFLLTPHRTL
eukprot:m.42100 g.42100  ORF g.42100 m.42100 type:complete len:337 (-) comp10647_c0_seq2:551-1561(-)